MTFVTALAVATSLPAVAVGSNHTEEVLAGFAAAGDTQELSVGASGAAAQIARDNYGASTPAQIVALETMRLAPTFVNDLTSAVQWPFPAGVPLSDMYGPRSCNGCAPFHKGIDMLPGEGTPIQVIADGTVLETGESDSGFGNFAIIEHFVDGKRITTLYAHMQWGSLQVVPGQAVSVGDGVGRVGSTGLSTGPHLHFEVTEDGDSVDPYEWLTEKVGR
ncbi:M23 family metallopeptidase [Amnibacterium flavum]|uniref:M23 family metallopeptidase n=1 Tax=Amnibacterium flavum TaxID=2173173 RepID=UPI001402CADB|nr:M23 family metallopeptidase [Amnibacterium flavum]